MVLKDIYELIPEINLIQNNELKEQCANVWLEVLEIGGWDKKDISTSPLAVKEVSADCPETGIAHIRHVIALTAKIYDEVSSWINKIGPCDRDTVVAGAVLHDVGKFLEYDRKDGVPCYTEYGKMFRHPCSGAYFAQKHGLSPKVVHMVLSHSSALSPEGVNAINTPESLILKCADNLCFSYAQLHFPGAK